MVLINCQTSENSKVSRPTENMGRCVRSSVQHLLYSSKLTTEGSIEIYWMGALCSWSKYKIPHQATLCRWWEEVRSEKGMRQGWYCMIDTFFFHSFCQWSKPGVRRMCAVTCSEMPDRPYPKPRCDRWKQPINCSKPTDQRQEPLPLAVQTPSQLNTHHHRSKKQAQI